MELTGKCKEDFLKSKFYPENGEVYFNDLPYSCKNALIIDFFDSVKIHIGIDYVVDCFDIEVKDYREFKKESMCDKYYISANSNDRNISFNSGFKIANKIYNQKK